MNWTTDQITEVLQHIHAIEESMIVMRRDIAEINATCDRMIAKMEQSLLISAPSICPDYLC
jgi:hypothetical protein